MHQLIAKKTANCVRLDLSLLSGGQYPIYDCLIVLNAKTPMSVMDLFIKRTKCVLAADGGANYLYNSCFRDIPNLKAIVGDLDSLSQETRTYYQKRKVLIKEDSNQDNNDFAKTVQYANTLGMKTLVCMGILGGRIDQQLCNLNAIEKYTKLTGQRFLALGQYSLMFMVQNQQEASIKINHLFQNKKVGMFCFGKSKVKTTGLKWNLEAGFTPDLEWGSFISSSNVILEEQITIKAENQLFFAIELKQSKEIKELTKM